MRAYTEYWVAMLLRGFLAVLAGTAILFLTGIAATVLLLPLAIVSTILCLAAYGVVDSALVIASSFMIPRNRPGRLVLRVQGVCGLIFGALMFSVIYDRVTIAWFLYLAAAQATAVAIAEFGVARGTADHHQSKWCYVSTVIAAASAIVLLSVGGLGHKNIVWVIYSYLGVFGFNLIALSAWMLFEDRHRMAADV
ncbi:MAG TPA: hypothetical protein VNU94_09925 [Acidobacteriaceae bacterium]|jgi:hypothetical protein|nr:hypothetical protein [Acidobacteriaceae bacterium]